MRSQSIAGVASVHHLRGAAADPSEPPRLLVEVPHGADTQAHYDALRVQLTSPLPEHLERFFHVNTDVGAWALGLRTAERYVEAVPTASAIAIRCEIPRTFVDVNRVIDQEPQGGLTPGMQPWITEAGDQDRLRAMHGAYTELVEQAYLEVCGSGGRALIPHTYAPRQVPIERVDLDIVKALEHVYAPERIETAPLRSEVDLITHTPEGRDLSPPGMAEQLQHLLAEHALTMKHNHAYNLHPVTMGARWANRWPGQVVCLEVRRDLVTYWEPFVPKALREETIETIAGCLTTALA